MFNRLLKNSGTCFDTLSMNGFCSIISIWISVRPEHVEGLREVFQQPVNVGTGVDTLNLER